MVGRADLHTHTKYSGMSKLRFLRFPDAVSEPKDVVSSAERRGLDVVCVTDHDTIKGAKKAARESSGVEVVIGEEVSTSDGEIIGLYLSESVPRDQTAEETIDRIHELGGVAIAPHPFSAHCSSVAEKLVDLDLDGVELFNAFHRDGYANDIAQKRCEGLPMAMTGGSDAHAPMMVGDGYTTFDGATGEELRRAILNGKTGFGGQYTTFRDFVWLTTMMTLNLQRTIWSSLLGADMPDDSSCSREIFEARAITRLIGLAGTMIFLLPPVTLTAGVIADKLHRSRSKLKWKELVGPGSTDATAYDTIGLTGKG
ncbi:MAG: PHP domain-containing protein [Methanobacteriota archaeon]|nr:MAG: PHP domain-containing protein [Euryarchaeota archaeon]